MLTVLLTLIYPFAVGLGHKQIGPRWLALLLVGIALTRIPLLKISTSARWLLIVLLILIAITVGSNTLLPLQLYPVLMNILMLSVFGYSLLFPPTIIERIARIREPDLPPRAIIYTRRVTQVWCVFFIINGCIALITVLWASPKIWTLYNGVIAYVLMGLLFGGEYLIRLRFKRHVN